MFAMKRVAAAPVLKFLNIKIDYNETSRQNSNKGKRTNRAYKRGFCQDHW